MNYRIIHFARGYKQDRLMNAYLTSLCEGEKAENSMSVYNKHTAIDSQSICCLHKPLSLRSLLLARRIRRKGGALVVEAHGSLTPYMLSHEGRIRKWILMLLGVRRLLSNSDAVIALTDAEKNRISQLSSKAHISVIKTEIYTSVQTIANECAEWQKLGRKVIDSRAPLLASYKERVAIITLISAALTRDTDTPRPYPSMKLEVLANADTATWRRIILLAEAEGVLSMMYDGAERLGISIPELNVDAVDRFPMRHPKFIDTLPCDKAIVKRSSYAYRLRRVCDGATPELKAICTLIVNAHVLVNQQRFSFKALACVYDAIKHTDYDEDELNRLVRRLHLRRFFRRLLGLLSDTMLLEEGYWPTKPLKPRYDWLKSRG